MKARCIYLPFYSKIQERQAFNFPVLIRQEAVSWQMGGPISLETESLSIESETARRGKIDERNHVAPDYAGISLGLYLASGYR